jgi:hypothetical protein
VTEQIRMRRIPWDWEHLWGLRRPLGGHTAHAVPLGAAWVDGIALCGFRPSGKARRWIAERHGWETADPALRPCPHCLRLAPGFYSRHSTYKPRPGEIPPGGKAGGV